MRALRLLAGPKALQRIKRDGLRAADVAIVPAAAGGPKGLIFHALDQWLFGHWLPTAPRERHFIGASIGAWRMAAAIQADPAAAFARLADHYIHQRYPNKPSAEHVTDVVHAMLLHVIQGHETEILAHPDHRLMLLAIRGKGLLHRPGSRRREMAGFAAASLTNLSGRDRLARHMERVVVADPRARVEWLEQGFDAFDTHHVALNQDNLRAALLASGTLPLIMNAMHALPGGPDGTYWDGGLIDYHLALPYAQAAQSADDIVLYPHFVGHIVPGWLDKALPWRRGQREMARGWFDNVVLLAPSPAFLAQLPQQKLPDRNDFKRYAGRDEDRIRDWKAAIAHAQMLRDELIAFIERPDAAQVEALA